MQGQLRYRHHWIFGVAALVVWIHWGWPVIRAFNAGATIKNYPVSALWFVPFAIFGAAVLAAMVPKLRTSFLWTLVWVQLACVAAMAFIVPWAGMSTFLVLIAWQVAMATGPAKALAWIAFQTLVIIGALAQALNPDLCWVIGESVALQLVLFLTAQALRKEADTARALAQTNRELRSAQAIIANNVRDAERCNLNDALEHLAHSVPRPAIHVAIAPGVRVGPDQAHALVRCAQEAVTNAVRHSEASNLWLEVTADGEGVRLVARNDGSARPAASAPGSGLVGMRERVEALGGRLAVRTGAGFGFTVDAWLPSGSPQAA